MTSPKLSKKPSIHYIYYIYTRGARVAHFGRSFHAERKTQLCARMEILHRNFSRPSAASHGIKAEAPRNRKYHLHIYL